MGRGRQRDGKPDEATLPPGRLQKLLGQAGVASRRGAEAMIAAGRVTVDGEVVTRQGVTVDPARAVVKVDGKRVLFRDEPVYLLLHKPRGTVCTAHDPQGRQRVFDLIRQRLPRVWSVGRLDFQTSGVLLITNDGPLTTALAHPSQRIERAYEVKLRDELSARGLLALSDGVELEDGVRAEPIRPQLLEGVRRAWWYGIVLHEGRNREVRRIFEKVGAQLQKLHRASFAGLTLAGVRPGRYRWLVPEEVEGLYKLAGLENPPSLKPKSSRDTRGRKPGRGGSGAGNQSRRPAGRGAR